MIICSDNLFDVFEGTDKDAIIGLLATRSKVQRHGISEAYQKQESKVSFRGLLAGYCWFVYSVFFLL
jgi:hypothetical protein